jgi:Siphovirus Gp157
MTRSAEHDMHRARQSIEAARVMREQIAALAEGDEDFIRDTLEGETDLETLIRAMLAGVGEDEAMADGLKAYAEQLSARRDRLAQRAKLRRTLICSAMEIAGRRSIETDVGTVTLSDVKPKAVVTDEAAIPSKFFKVPPPVLDMPALNTALRDKEDVPGAHLSNGGTTIRILRK